MNLSDPAVQSPGALSNAARERLLSRRGDPLLLADWERVLMIHFEVDPDALQRDVPFQLDLMDRRAFVSLVAFTMRGLRPRRGGKLTAWLFRPIGTHHFLNVRTYVQQGDESGIYFLAEWLSNWLAVQLGPVTFGLPYRYGRIRYEHTWHHGELRGCVAASITNRAFTYQASLPATARFARCEMDSLDEWLMERYTAFTCAGTRANFFRIWHSPWPQCQAEVIVKDDSLLRRNWRWFGEARLCGANFSPGVQNVWMGRPHAIDSARRNL